MSCHPTDPNNDVTEAAQAEGYRPAPEHSEVRECAGAIILQQREVHAYSHLADLAEDDDPKRRGGTALAAYRRLRGALHLTQEGLFAVASRAMMTWPGEVPMRRDHDLDEPVAVDAGVLEWRSEEWT